MFSYVGQPFSFWNLLCRNGASRVIAVLDLRRNPNWIRKLVTKRRFKLIRVLPVDSGDLPQGFGYFTI